MSVTVIINEPKLLCEDSVGDVVGIFKEGDNVKIKLSIGNERYGTIDNIFSDCIELDTEDGFFSIELNDIDKIEEW